MELLDQVAGELFEGVDAFLADQRGPMSLDGLAGSDRDRLDCFAAFGEKAQASPPVNGVWPALDVVHRRHLPHRLGHGLIADVGDPRELVAPDLVGHDWGGSLAFDWAARHPDRVRGVAFMETILHPTSLAAFPEGARERFVAMRTPGAGEKIEDH